MKVTPSAKALSTAFTRIEMLIVALILGTMLVLLAQVNGTSRTDRRRPLDRTRNEIANLIVAINQYEATYSHFPESSNVIESGLADFTFGTFGTSMASLGITNPGGYQANNSEIMAILTDNPNSIVNTNHCRNPARLAFFNARIAPDTNSPGLGPDGVLRDRWGNPVIISIHLKEDETCRDAFYSLPAVSGTNPPHIRTRIMIWSLGPDGKADRNQPADSGVNADNVVSWK